MSSLSVAGQLIRLELARRIDRPFYVDEVVHAVVSQISFEQRLDDGPHYTDLPAKAGENIYYATKYIKSLTTTILRNKRSQLRDFKAFNQGNGIYCWKHISIMDRADIDRVCNDYDERITALERERKPWHLLRDEMTKTMTRTQKKVYAESVIVDLGWLPTLKKGS
jgi:hypothetical protein